MTSSAGIQVGPLVPGLPVLGWDTLRWPGAGAPADVPCVLDHPRAAYVTSGRAAILLALQALRMPRGSRVLVPTYHCPTMVAPIVALGHEPVFYPIGASGQVCEGWLARLPTAHLGALLAPHFFGLPQPMAALREWCDANGVALIEDCAHALFGLSDGRPVGRWGDAAIASLTKFLPVDEGGLLMLNRDSLELPELAPRSVGAELKSALDIVDLGARYGRLSGLNLLIRGALGGARWLRRQARGSDAAAALPAPPVGTPAADGFSIDASRAHQRLTRAARFVATHAQLPVNALRRRAHFEQLLDLLPAGPDMRPLFARLPAGAVPYVFPLWVRQPDPGYLALKVAGTPLSRWNWLWPGVPELPGDHGLGWSHHLIQVPCHQDLLPQQLAAVAQALRRAFGGQR